MNRLETSHLYEAMNSNLKRSVITERDNAHTVTIRVPLEVLRSSWPSVSLSIPSEPGNNICVHGDFYTEFLIQNHSNFKRSDSPVRFMYYSNGSWADFSPDVIDSLRLGFADGKAAMEVGVGGSRCLFDLYRMLQVDLETGNPRSIAWVDVQGKYFFPKTFVDWCGEFANAARDSTFEAQNPNVEISNVREDLASETPHMEIEIRVEGDVNLGKRKREEQGIEHGEGGGEKAEVSSSNNHVGKKTRLATQEVESPRWPKAILLGEGEGAYQVVKEMFLSGIGSTEPGATVTAIHRWVRRDPVSKARNEVFLKQMVITKANRGEANMVFAWHGTSTEGLTNILRHGFVVPVERSGLEAHGVGIYLSPARLPQLSAMISEADENGEKHVLLCRVILGRCEKVEAGSRQMYPSSLDFDTGVDDLDNPKLYVVWCANMNSHILPECIVSYKSSNHRTGLVRGSSLVKSGPWPLRTLLAKLYSKLGGSLPPSRVQELKDLYIRYKDGKVDRDIFNRELRNVVGDEILVSTIHEICGRS
ncbi:NAD(+) ADP-ribosyltransferase [Bertholletia excelsa]